MAALQNRERELLAGRGYGWCDGLAGAEWKTSGESKSGNQVIAVFCRGAERTGMVGLTFRRGFVEEVACSWDDWVRHADAIRAATPLRKVRLTTWPVDLTRVDGAPPHNVMERFAQSQLSMRWPSITFELPPGRVIRGSGWTVSVGGTEMSVVDPSRRPPCEYCHDTGRTDAADSPDGVIDCPHCRANSLACTGCTNADCPGCGRTQPIDV